MRDSATVPAGPTPRLAVVVVTYDGAHLLPACLDALARQTMDREAFDVVVVDNGSTDGTAEMLAARYPWVRVIASPENLGFAGGNNLALRTVETARTPHVVLLNNDARPEPEFLARVVAPFEHADAGRVAAVTAKVLFAEDDPELGPIINSTGNLIGRDGRGHDRSFGRPDTGPPDGRDVFGLYGGASALRMAALDEAGLFDDDLFLYFEDTDLSWRLRAHGWEIWHEPTAVVRHVYAASSGPASERFVYQQARNMLIVYTRHAPVGTAVWVVVRFLLALPWRAIRELPRLAPTRVRLLALGGYLRRLPRLLVERREIWAGPAADRADVAGWLEPRRERGRRTGGSAAPSRGDASTR